MNRQAMGFDFGDQGLRIFKHPEGLALIKYGATIEIPWDELETAIDILQALANHHKREKRSDDGE